MPQLLYFLLLVAAFTVAWLSPPAAADLPVPPEVLDPQTPAEAWNVIRLATANTTRLLDEERLQELPDQVILCSPALRTLASLAPPEHKDLVDKNTTLAFRQVSDTAQAAKAGFLESTRAALTRLQATLEALQTAYASDDVDAEIYVCPLHPKMLATGKDTPCRFCDGPLRVRRIRYSELYVTPDPDHAPPQLVLQSDPPTALEVGAPATLRVQVQSAAGDPLPLSNLIPLHAEPVRFLLVDQTLSDFHLLTPAALDAPGTFETALTPAAPGPYRLWAELAPEESALPEHPSIDVGGDFHVVDRTRHDFPNAYSATAGDLHFKMTFSGGSGGFPPLKQVGMMRIHVTDGAGQPMNRLEPFMNAFAHVTGIYEDGETLLRLHPVGGDILRDDIRGGPWLAFKIYPPRAGFLRLFCQIKIDGRIITAPLGIHIRAQ